MVTPEAKRKAIEHLQESFGQSLRKLCGLIGLNRSSWYYQTQPDKNEPIRGIGCPLDFVRARLVGKGTTVDTCYLVYGSNDPESMILARSEISDHLPVFAEFIVS